MLLATGVRRMAAVKASDKLTLRDRLSRLTFEQACKLLGPQGRKLIQLGAMRDYSLAEDVYLQGDLFRMRFPAATGNELTTVTITLMAEAKDRLHWRCDHCGQACEHVGAALSLILEEKTALGLAAPPPERKPVESLSEEAAVEQALFQRAER